ncbi:MAG: nicotinate phosphoribosyltransferase [Acidobacteria bacterium]|nr:nicotinate phosphoribosyltransferase [Acidobacteriota bacterium]
MTGGLNLRSAISTDLYQLTMAYGYWKCGIHNRKSVFHLFFRQAPFGGSYSVACGLKQVLDFVSSWQFTDAHLSYMDELRGRDGKKLFDPDFLNDLKDLRITCRIDAVPEGTPVFAHEPLLRVEGPLWQCQLLETPLLTIVNYQTLIATKASRICMAASPDPVIEFGMRRAHGLNGALSASYASFVGGCAGTSNVEAGAQFGIPVKGTHAHSWVMSFEDEPAAFAAYANAMPNNCVFLVDTYDTVQGIRYAIEAAENLRREGHELLGIRLDSGDLLTLSRQARALLDDAGFFNAQIMASNDLDEYEIARLKQLGAPITLWGVGTKMVTAYDQPALGGVYKLGAYVHNEGSWKRVMKTSAQAEKATLPGRLNVTRFYRDGRMVADMIFDELDEECSQQPVHRMSDESVSMEWEHCEPLLIPVFDDGVIQIPAVEIEDSRKRCLDGLQTISPECLALNEPAAMNVFISKGLSMTRQVLRRQMGGSWTH